MMHNLPVWSVQQTYAIDKKIDNLPRLSLQTIMNNVGAVVAEFIISFLNAKSRRLIIFIGKGNNGGDGLAAAKQLLHYGYTVDLFFVFQSISFPN